VKVKNCLGVKGEMVDEIVSAAKTLLLTDS